jgi:integrase
MARDLGMSVSDFHYHFKLVTTISPVQFQKLNPATGSAPNDARLTAVRAGIKKRIGWHTFRHTYSSTLIASGENVNVVQELMRHASSRFTLEVTRKRRRKPNEKRNNEWLKGFCPRKD